MSTLSHLENLYFNPQTMDESMPILLDEATNIKYSNIEKIFDLYYHADSLLRAKASSLEERNSKELRDNSFVYGEITFRSMSYIIEYLKHSFDLQPENFYDLGSGSGKGVLAASLIYPFDKCIGIEFLNGLNEIGIDMINNHDTTFPEIFNKNKKLFDNIKQIPKLECINGDFLKQKLENVSLNSTCFTSELMTSLREKVEKECKKGSIVITFSKQLNGLSSEWEIQPGFRRLMTWGIATVYIHKKKF